ncbi:MAG: tetratricopeptide repeat protein [Gemmatimonadetes bacterium]|nr:tetratricopeptide repeat protein [Gemmatimonadota bacterium]
MKRLLASTAIALLAVIAPLGGVEAQGSPADGLQALKQGAYGDAIRLLRPLARNGDPLALRGQFYAHFETGEYVDAEAAAREGVAAATSGAHALLGQVLMATGKLDEARTVLDEGTGVNDASGAAHARLRLALLEYTYGDRERAYDLFDGFIDFYNGSTALGYQDLAAVGVAMVHLSRRVPALAHDALRALDEAAAAGATDHRAQLATGRLFLERYDAAQAAESFRAVLAENEAHPEALFGLAMVARLEGGGGAEGPLAAALEGNENLVEARTLAARIQLMGGDRVGALEEIERALDVNPADLSALATSTAIHYLSHEQPAYEDGLARIQRLSQAPTAAYELIAELTADHRKYADAVRFAEMAVAVDSTAWTGLGLAGLNQVRLGQVDEGRAKLERAFAGDPFNLWFKNTLDLVDTFAEYRIVHSEHFRFLLHNSEADLLEPYIVPLAERAWSDMAARYGYRPHDPIRVEVYPRHADFSVRTVGLVGIGALGVSFGPALAMDSPSALGRGEFNWASTLWHEIAHSFHMGVSNNEVPRWFSEGLAVHEQRKANPEWGHQASPGFVRALAQDELRPVSELDHGFSHPRRPGEVVESYYQASLVFEVIERDHGFPAIVRMLEAYRDGRSNREAFQLALGVDLADFDDEFDEFLRDRFSAAVRSVGSDVEMAVRDLSSARDAVASAPGAFGPRMALATALFAEGQMDDAARHFETALELFPQYGGPQGPHWFLGRIREEQGRLEEAADHYESLLALNESHYEGRLALVALLQELGRDREAADAMAAVPFVHPYEIGDQVALAEMLEAQGDMSGAVVARQAVIALDPVDRANAYFLLARTLHRAGASGEARSELLKALEIAPNYEEALDLLLELRSSTGTQGAGTADPRRLQGALMEVVP